MTTQPPPPMVRVLKPGRVKHRANLSAQARMLRRIAGHNATPPERADECVRRAAACHWLLTATDRDPAPDHDGGPVGIPEFLDVIARWRGDLIAAAAKPEIVRDRQRFARTDGMIRALEWGLAELGYTP